MNNNVEQIKERLNIVDIISGYIKLTKAGTSYKALCPFHNEKTPSFMVSPARQSWHCFGCGEGGDIFTFVEKIENIEFLDTLKILAEKAGIELEYSDPKMRSEKDRLYEICEVATQFFIASLNDLIINYLHKRGLADETISEWRLGYSPDSWDSLFSFLLKKGYRDNEIEKSGLIVRGTSIKYHDRFRNRLMFPIFDTNSRVVAFSGRIMSDIISSKTEKSDTGKYINSPETVLFSKSRILYGLNRAKTDIRKNDAAILVEGQMDVILPWQDGVKNIIATSGTALTEDQLSIIKRLTSNLIMAFDMDDAGFRATKRGIDLAGELGFNISVLRLESGKDAADFVLDNPGKFQEMIEKSESIMSYYFKEIFSAKGGSANGGKKFSTPNQQTGVDSENEITIERKKFIAIKLLSEIKRLPSIIERSNWIRELSLRLGVSEVDLKEEMEQLETKTNIGDNQRNPISTQRESAVRKSRKEILSERLLALLLKKPESIAETVNIATYLPSSDFEFLSAFIKASADKPVGTVNFSDIRSVLNSDLRSRLDFLYMFGDFEIGKAGFDFDLGQEIVAVTKEIEREHCKEILLKIGVEIKKCEVEGLNLDNLTKEFQDISKRLMDLSKK